MALGFLATGAAVSASVVVLYPLRLKRCRLSSRIRWRVFLVVLMAAIDQSEAARGSRERNPREFLLRGPTCSFRVSSLRLGCQP